MDAGTSVWCEIHPLIDMSTDVVVSGLAYLDDGMACT